MNSFEWGYFGFDGPVLPRDAGYDVPDNTTAGPTQTSGYGSPDTGYPTQNLGYTLGMYPDKLSFTLHGVSTANATGAIVVFNWNPWDESTPGIQVSVNGNTPVPDPDPQVDPADDPFHTQVIPVPLSEVQNGTNTITFSDPNLSGGGPATYGESISNIDLIVQGVGGTVSPSK